jgi:hypothetical protein
VGAVKWVLVFFAAASLMLYALAKVMTVLNPPRPGMPRPAALRRVERAARWTVLVPAAVGLLLLAGTLLGRP